MYVNPRPRVLLLIPHLDGGGAERVTSLLAQSLSPEKYELHLGLITQAEPAAGGLPIWVHTHALGAPRVRAGAFRLLRLVRRVKPDLILSGMAHLNFLVLLLRPFYPRGTHILVRQNATVSSALDFDMLPGYTRLLYRLLYRRAHRIICQSQSMARDLARELNLPEGCLAVMPNPVDVDEIRNSTTFFAPQPGFGPHLLAVGRLSREKGFDLLLQALASLRAQFPNASLTIAGVGPEEAVLKSECHALGLDEAVCFAGRLARPWSLFPGATLFVLPSRHEGLPNALLEAAAGGLPIVALPASGGVSDLLRGQPGVWLAPQVSADALAASLLAALQELQPGKRFGHPFVDQFQIARAIQAYESLIDRTLEIRRIS
jgi:glycosyltransferase involved in cell wall biosynthesis